ncbi:hypothetical protein BT96DRAFT_922257 [Gymnopus androsaceus JB14]|uniref:Uncharacterized protein n=1 Tax=Gymnopus androsaceus JB14 TaxID=1447944 RepID=A0A6A4HEM7_9AGAR|nr:hypothetical protein BT96DRAFT_922257 [Gymnopus androsaceus JB14]
MAWLPPLCDFQQIAFGCLIPAIQLHMNTGLSTRNHATFNIASSSRGLRMTVRLARRLG